jgi:hypothetical protein
MPKTVVAVVVYDRYFNLVHWLECWEKCDRTGADLVVIHNTDNTEPQYSEVCEEHGVQYIKRKNIGYDIGAFQDLCRGRLGEFPQDWERVLWCTDDTFPMDFDFVKRFSDKMEPGVGVACMEISVHVTKHIRTTGFMIDRPVAEKLNFPKDPVVTKQDCYLFEHREKTFVFYNQIFNLSLKVEQVAPRHDSPLWDTGYHRRLDRKREHLEKFGEVKTGDMVLFVCPIYQSYPQIISSLLMQTHQNWRLYLVHDGPETKGVENYIPNDPRITFIVAPKRGGSWGHYIRQIGIEVNKDEADFVVVSNPDNYHVPTYCEYMLKAFKLRPSAVAAYCSQMVHSYKAWQVINCQLKRGFLDSAGVMVRSKKAAEVGWRDIETHSADWVYFTDLINRYGAHKFEKVEGCLIVHN